ncbi:MAG: hypothetical protein KBF31_02720, partial [Chitinophagales bacterium]|nr:hypothetical protein [Chitinophagales bacterium]
VLYLRPIALVRFFVVIIDISLPVSLPYWLFFIRDWLFDIEEIRGRQATVLRNLFFSIQH